MCPQARLILPKPVSSFYQTTDMHSRLKARHNCIRRQLAWLEQRGVIKDVWGHSMSGKKWCFTPNGYSERSLTTSQVEDFIMGAMAAFNAGVKTPGDLT